MTITRGAVPFVVLLAVVALAPTAVAAVPGTPTTPVTVDAAAYARSDVLAGYRVVADGGLQHRVSATVTVPTIDCTTRAREPLTTTVSLSGTPVAEGGTLAVFLLVSATCRRGAATYEATGFSASGGVGIGVLAPVDPGTVLTLVATSAPARSTFRITTAGSASVLSGRGNGFHVDRAQVTTQGGYGGAFPRPTAPVAFTQVAYDGAPLAAAAPRRLTQVDDTGAVIARASGLGAGGDAFTVRFTPAL